MKTITKDVQTKLIDIFNRVLAANKRVNREDLHRQVGEALGHTGATAIEKGREFVDALKSGDVSLEAVAKEIAFQSALSELGKAADALPPGAFTRTTASGVKITRYAGKAKR